MCERSIHPPILCSSLLSVHHRQGSGAKNQELQTQSNTSVDVAGRRLLEPPFTTSQRHVSNYRKLDCRTELELIARHLDVGCGVSQGLMMLPHAHCLVS